MPESDQVAHSGDHAPSEDDLKPHELTPLEGFFDNLFNHHMVLPQTPEDPTPGEGLGDSDPAHGKSGATPV